jgi:transketolase
MGGLIRDTFGEAISARVAYGKALVKVGQDREDVVVLTADVCNSDHSYMFAEAFPERFINVGIAEQSLVDVAVGLAHSGKVAVANTFAFLFATRALEQVRTHLCYGEANVKMMGAYAGLSDSFDGPTHQTVVDVAIMRSLQRMTVVVPSDPTSIAKLLPKVIDWPGPVYFRLCRNEVPYIYTEEYEPEIGKGIVVIEGSDATIIGCGVMMERCVLAARELAKDGVRVRVVEMHTIKPLDEELMLRCARETGAMVTAEEHSVIGGLGGAVAEVLIKNNPVPLEMVGVADRFCETGPYDALLDRYGMSVEDIVNATKRTIARKS